MADGGDRHALHPKKTTAKKKVSLLRNAISTILLVTFATVAVLEFRAKYAHDAAMKTLLSRLDAEDDLLSIEDAEKIIGKPADGEGVKEDRQLKKTYRWRGVVREHKLNAYYTVGKPVALVKIDSE